MMAFRALVMFSAIPLFRHSHYGFDWRDALVCTWGGLRGAVSLALALAITSSPLIVDCDDASATAAAGHCSFAGAARCVSVLIYSFCISRIYQYIYIYINICIYIYI